MNGRELVEAIKAYQATIPVEVDRLFVTEKYEPFADKGIGRSYEYLKKRAGVKCQLDDIRDGCQKAADKGFAKAQNNLGFI